MNELKLLIELLMILLNFGFWYIAHRHIVPHVLIYSAS